MVLATLAAAQDKKTTAKTERYDFRPLMQKIWDAWGTLNPDNAAKYYSKDARSVFFDIAPLKYDGWNDYAAGVKKVFADYKSAKFTLYAGGHIFQRGNFAWAEDTGHAAFVRKSGAKEDADFRWTVLWEKDDADWLIIHEHVSTPAK